jgi:flagellar biosynthesis GTPase FlhF
LTLLLFTTTITTTTTVIQAVGPTTSDDPCPGVLTEKKDKAAWDKKCAALKKVEVKAAAAKAKEDAKAAAAAQKEAKAQEARLAKEQAARAKEEAAREKKEAAEKAKADKERAALEKKEAAERAKAEKAAAKNNKKAGTAGEKDTTAVAAPVSYLLLLLISMYLFIPLENEYPHHHYKSGAFEQNVSHISLPLIISYALCFFRFCLSRFRAVQMSMRSKLALRLRASLRRQSRLFAGIALRSLRRELQ